MRHIKKLTYNWFATPNGEEYQEFTVGVGGVKRINFRRLGNSVFYCVEFDSGDAVIVFNPNLVFDAGESD